VAFHFFVNSFGQVFGAVNPVVFASRLAPRHCGQSCAHPQRAVISSATPVTAIIVRFVFFMIAPFVIWLVKVV
jgi:hypothetical protein